MKSENIRGLIDILREARDFLARPGNNFDWSSWEDAPAALREIDGLISRLEVGDLPERSAIELLFLPTGPIQEVSVSSGWGQEFIELSNRFDRAVNKIYGRDPRVIAQNRAEAYAYMREAIDGRGRWYFLFVFALSTGFTIYLGVAHETPEIYFPLRLSGDSAWRVLVFASIFFGVLTIVNWIFWFKRDPKK